MRIKTNNIELYYEKIGNGSPLILLHGNGEDHHIFDPLIKKLQKHFTVYAVDSRNHGQSTKTKDYSYETMAQDIHSFILDLGLQEANLVGFSDGAIIGLFLAMKKASPPKKMALLGVNLTPEDFTEESYQFIKDTYEKNKDPLFKLMLEEPNIELETLRAIKTPALIIAGEDDVFKPESFSAIQHALPDAKLLIMKGHGHDSYITDQDILYPDLLGFFDN